MKKEEPKNFINRKNVDSEKIQKIKIEPNSLSLIHINFCSLIRNHEHHENLLNATNEKFDLITISKSRIMKYLNLTQNINM